MPIDPLLESLNLSLAKHPRSTPLRIGSRKLRPDRKELVLNAASCWSIDKLTPDVLAIPSAAFNSSTVP